MATNPITSGLVFDTYRRLFLLKNWSLEELRKFRQLRNRFAVSQRRSEEVHINRGLALLKDHAYDKLSPAERQYVDILIDDFLLDTEISLEVESAKREAALRLTSHIGLTIDRAALDQLPACHRAQIDRFLHAIDGTDIGEGPVAIYLVGSMAYCCHILAGTVDVVVVSDTFTGKPPYARSKDLRMLEKDKPIRILPLGVTFPEFSSNRFPGAGLIGHVPKRKIAWRN